MKNKKELIKNTFILGIGKVSTQVISFLLLPLYTVYLTASDYGFADLALTYVYLLVPTISLQMEMAVFRFLIDSRHSDSRKRDIISNSFHIIVLAMLCLIAVFYILNMFLHIKYGWYVVANICTVMLSGFFLQIARGLGYNKKYANASIITAIVTLIFTILFVAVLKLGIAGMFLSILMANVACSFYLFSQLGLGKYINLNHNSAIKKELTYYSLPLVPNGISFWVVNLSNRTVLTLLLGVAANGIYAVSNKFSMILMSVFGIFNMSLTESISLHIKETESDIFISDTFNLAIKTFSYLGLIIISVVPFIFYLFIDKSYYDAIKYIPIIIIACIFNIVVSMYGAIYVAQKETIKVANTTILAAVLNVVLTIILVSFFGLYGAAIASMVSYFILMCLRYYDVKKSININYNKADILVIVIGYIIVLGLNCLALMWSYLICLVLVLSITIFACRSEIRAAIVYIRKRFYNNN